VRAVLRSARLVRVSAVGRRYAGVLTPVGRRYADVLTPPGAWGFFLAAVPARVGVAMTSLGLLWLVRWGTGSYAAAGIVSGVFAVTSALTAPLIGRLAARFGQSRVLAPTAIAHACSVGVLVIAVAAHCPLWTIALLGVAAGAALPPVASLTATRWSVLLAGSPLLPTAFALESLSNELAYLFGPALVGLVSALVVAPAGAVLAAALVFVGCLALARRRGSDPGLREPVSARSAAVGRRFLVPAVVNLGIGFFFGALQVAVTAFATEHHVAGSAGLIYSILSVTSLIAGFAYGARKWQASAPRQLAVALGLLTACSVPMVFAATPGMLAIVLLLPGFGLAPSMIVVSLLTERLVPKPALTRAFAMLNSAGAVGTALASAIAGRLVDAHGASWGFALAAGAVALSTLVAVRKGWWSGTDPTTSPASLAG
jgi:MFS family permease